MRRSEVRSSDLTHSPVATGAADGQSVKAEAVTGARRGVLVQSHSGHLSAKPRCDLAARELHVPGALSQYLQNEGWTQGLSPFAPSRGNRKPRPFPRRQQSEPCGCGVHGPAGCLEVLARPWRECVNKQEELLVV